mgnify:CR=1 FL=1
MKGVSEVAKAGEVPGGLEIALVALGAACFAAAIRTAAGAACFGLSVVLLMGVYRLRAAEVLRRLLPFALFAALAVIFGGLGRGEPALRLGPIVWSFEAAAGAAVGAARLVGLGAVAVWINLAVGSGRLTAHLLSAARRLKRRTGIDLEALFAGAAIALSFLPLLQREAGRLRLAWEARGAGLLGRGPVGRGMYAAGIAVPLMAAALRRAEQLADAIETRGTGAGVLAGFSLPASQEPEGAAGLRPALAVAAVWLPLIACVGMGWR